MTKQEILELAEFPREKRNAYAFQAVCENARLLPLIETLAESNESLIETIEEVLHSDELTVGQSNELLANAIAESRMNLGKLK